MAMGVGLRKLTLTVHVGSSVGLLGAVTAFFALSIAGLTSADVQVVRSSYLAMDLIARLVILPLAFASLFIGIVESLGTQWGLVRHYWVVAKLVLTAIAVIVLALKMKLIADAASLAAEEMLDLVDLHAAGLQLTVHAGGGLLVLLLPMALSVYKPRGLTPRGRRSLATSVQPAS